MKRFKQTAILVASAAFLAPTSSFACGVCMGQTDGSQIGGALNGAIFVMIGFLGVMLTGISAVGVSIWRRSKNPLPTHVELAEMIGTQSTSK